ncbi:hypothetical protein [Fusobacterium vincentii]|uniref:hypothetical protein n=1 Tax=Fusobacterium vincentii TaxID=155615 RepID=UPI001C6E75EF|nr:hypothetical protein [Fusobacterium vincentii]QYR57669.1 hypothetical protein JY399_03565 [Fusobacterium vincentii]
MKKLIRVFGFLGLIFFLTTYNSVEAKPINKGKKVKAEKIEEGRIITVSVNEAKEVEMFTKVDITKMRAKDVLEEFDRYAQMYNGKVIPEVDKRNEYQLLNINEKWRTKVLSRKGMTIEYIIELYRDRKTNKLFTGRIKDNVYGIYYNYIYDGLYKRNVIRKELNAYYEEEKIGDVLSAEEISYADNGEIYVKRMFYTGNASTAGGTAPFLLYMEGDEEFIKENFQGIQELKKYRDNNWDVDYITVLIGVPLFSGSINPVETIYYVWDSETGKFITKLRKIEHY